MRLGEFHVFARVVTAAVLLAGGLPVGLPALHAQEANAGAVEPPVIDEAAAMEADTARRAALQSAVGPVFRFNVDEPSPGVAVATDRSDSDPPGDQADVKPDALDPAATVLEATVPEMPVLEVPEAVEMAAFEQESLLPPAPGEPGEPPAPPVALPPNDFSEPGFQPLEPSFPVPSEPMFLSPPEPLPIDYLVDPDELEDECDECSPCKRLFAFRLYKTSADIGIGHERVALATFEIDQTQPFNRVQLRINGATGLETPDRAEYFWARPGVGPEFPERSVDYQELRFLMETGGDRFSALMEAPIRIIDPDINDDTAGLSDISLGTKLLLVDGRSWQLTQVFRTYLKSGSDRKGLGSGHTSLEPGLVARYEWTPETFLHLELKYLFPVGADPDFAGEVLRYGFGISTVCYETDTFAAMPTLEFVGWSVLDGLKTLPNGDIVEVDGENIISVLPGLRLVLGPEGDLGLFELGIGGGVTVSGHGWYDSLLRLDLRFSF